MNLKVGWIVTAFILSILAKVFAGGMYLMWVSLIFFAILIYQSGITAATISSKAKSLKVFAWTVLIVIFLINILSRMTGKSLDAATNGTDALSLLLFASLLAMFATKEAGWTTGATGKKWIIRLFVVTFIYAVLSGVFHAIPRAVDRFVADGNWLAESYGERKLVKEVKAAGKELKEDLMGEKDKTGGGTAKVDTSPGFQTLPDGTIVLDPGATFQLPAGTKPIRFSFHGSGVSFLDKRVKVESPTVVTLPNGEKTREFVADPEAHARVFGSTPCFRDVKPFFFTLSPIDGEALIRAKPVGETCK